MPAWDTPARRLPIAVRPAAGELLGSYLTALAEANRLPVSVLVSWIGRSTATDISRGQDAWLNQPAALRLASIAGRPVNGLLRALPTLTEVRAFAESNAPAIHVVPPSASGPAQQACPRCTARGVPGAVLVRAASHQPLCQRHKLWLRDWRAPLDHAPELVHAQRLHCRHVRRHGSGGHAERASTAAAWIVLMWALKGWHRALHEMWNDRLSRLGVTQTIISGSGMLAAMTYPEVVTLTGLLAQPAWTARRGTGPAAWPRLLSAVQRKLPVDSSSFDARDPLTEWLAIPARWDAQPAARIPPSPSASSPPVNHQPPPRPAQAHDRPPPTSVSLTPSEDHMARFDAAPDPEAARPTTSPNSQALAAVEAAAGLLERAAVDGCAAVTARAYLADWGDFARWCAARGDNPLPATGATVASYLTELAASRTNATAQRRHAAIAKVHELARLTSPTRSAAVRQAMRQLRGMPERQHVRHVAAADTTALRQLLATLDPTADEPPESTARKRRQRARDRALLLIGFAAGLRRSELVGLDVADILHTPSGLEILVRQPASAPPQPPRRIQLGTGTDPATCPVIAWQAWQEAAGLTDGPAFRPVDRWGALRAGADRSGSAVARLSDAAVAGIVKRCAAQADFNPAEFSGHSLRAGFVVEATRQEMPLEQIIARAGFSTALSYRYVHRADLWAHNPAARIGL